MRPLSKVLREGADNGLWFFCPGCRTTHQIKYGDGPGPRWGWNGDGVRPTFTPSVLETSGHYVSSHKPGDPCWCTYAQQHPEEKDDVPECYRCHSSITDGRIQYLGDCTHALAGQTVDLPPWPPGRGEGG